MPIKNLSVLKGILDSGTSAKKAKTRKQSSKKLKKKQNVDISLPSPMVALDVGIEFNSQSSDAVDFFKEDPESFKIYHRGYQRQLALWPDDPLAWIVDYLKEQKHQSSKIVVDLGCGDARLAKQINSTYTVRSFDLVSTSDLVEVADMAHTPIADKSVDYVVFCLSLMGTNVRDFVLEANRILKMHGELIIVEVASRFDGEFKRFVDKLRIMGFKMKFSEVTKDSYFSRSRLMKVKECAPSAQETFPDIFLKPCVYKKR